MNSSSPARPPGRPVDSTKRDAMIATAWSLFLAHGVSAVSMESVAEGAGVSKVTLYKHFADKTALLEAGVLVEMELIEAAQSAPSAGADDLDLAQRLRVFGLGILHFLASENAIAFYATLAGELSRHPDLAQQFWNSGPGRTRANLTRLIQNAAARGEVTVSNPQHAADHLFGMWQGFTNFQYSLGIPEDSDIATRVDSAIEAFLRAYTPPTTSE